MTDILSQDEIDKLLKSGFGDAGADDDGGFSPFDQPKKSKPKKTSSTFSHSFEQDLPSFDSMMSIKKSATVKRSSVISDDKKYNVHSATFPSFDTFDEPSESTELGTILNITLEIRVELGKTLSTIREVLDMGTGSVIELDKQNGEPVDMVVNKKAFAKGEMIVIGENFGARITDILSVHEIIEALR